MGVSRSELIRQALADYLPYRRVALDSLGFFDEGGTNGEH
jgi:hypothetical protein